MKKQYLCRLILCVLLFCGCSDPHGAQTVTSISLSCDEETISAGKTATITYSVTPADLTLNEDCFYSSGGTLILQEDHLSFQSDVPGTYEVYGSKDDVRSNTITIVVTEDPSIEPDEQETPASSLIGDVTPHNAPMSVDWLLENADMYVDTKTQVWIQGELPQAKRWDKNGELCCVLYNDDFSRFIILQGEITIGSCHAAVVGTLTTDASGQYILLVDSVKAFN